MDEQLSDLLSEFATDVDAASSQMNNHELDIDGWSHEINRLIDDLIPKIKAL